MKTKKKILLALILSAMTANLVIPTLSNAEVTTVTEITVTAETHGESVTPPDIKEQHPEITDFVTRLYSICLGRNPDKNGLESWVTHIVNGDYTAAYTVKGFFGSREFKGKRLTDSDYVRTLYKVMLNREPAQSEINYWVERRQMGVTDEYMIRGFVASAEFSGICENSGVERGNITLTNIRDKNPNITGFCARMYTCCLGRSFDIKGLEGWVDKVMNQGYTAADVALGFFNSSEFKSKNLSDSEYVSAFYKTILNRTPAQSEIEYWAKRRNHGVSNTSILRGFVASKEFKEICEKYGMTQGTIAKPYVLLDVMEYNQHPDYPTGCESAALYMLLKYYDIDVTMAKIVDVLPKGPTPYWDNGKLYGANPETEFVGNPTSYYSYGVFNKPIAQTAEKFLSGVSTKKGASLNEVISLLDAHIPVIAWYSTRPYSGITYTDSWYDYKTGDYVRWPAGEHAIVVCGYDSENIIYRDPDIGSTRKIPYATFENVFNQLGGRIVYYGY